MPPLRALFYAANIGAVVIAVRAAMGKPPELPLAIAALLAYVVLYLFSSFVLRARVFVDAIVRGPRKRDAVALTFDGAAGSEVTTRILARLEAASAKATFFVRGIRTKEDADQLRAIAARGHTIGVAGWDADRFLLFRGPKRLRADLERSLDAIEAITDTRPVLFRPFGAQSSLRLARVADDLNLVVVAWSLHATRPAPTMDPSSPLAQERIDRRRASLHRGAIVRVDEDVRALDELLRAIELESFTIASLEEWI